MRIQPQAHAAVPTSYPELSSLRAHTPSDINASIPFIPRPERPSVLL